MTRSYLASIRRDPDVCAISLLLLAVLIFFAPLWLQPSHILFSGFSDLILSTTGWQELIRKTLREQGELPLWCPHIQCGVPLVGNPACWLFYPLNWLVVLLPVNLSTTLLVLMHLVIGAVGSYAYLRWGLRVGAWPALAGAFLAVFGGKLLLHQLVPGHLGFLPLVWLFWCMLGVDLLVRSDSWRSAGLLGLFLGLMGLSLFTQFCLYAACLVAGYFVFRWVSEGCHPLSALGKFLAAGILAGMLSAVQLLPVFETAGSSARNALTSLDFALSGSLHAQDVLAFLRPSANTVAGWTGETFGWEQAFFLGLIPLLCIALGVGRRERRAELVFFLAASAVVVLHALGRGTPFFGLLYEFVPGFRYFRIPGRALFMLGFLVPPLVALGLESILETPSKPRAIGAIATLMAVLALAFSAGDKQWLADTGFWLLGLSLLYGGILLLLAGRKLRPEAACAGLSACLLLETWSFHWPLLQTRDFAEVFPAVRIADIGLTPWLSSGARITDIDREVFHPLIAEYELVRDGGYDVNGFNPLVSERYVRFMSRVTGGPPRPEVWIPGLKPSQDESSPGAALLGYLNLAQWLFPGRNPETGAFGIYRRPSSHCLPRAYVAPRRKVVDSLAVLDAMAEPDARQGQVVVLQEDAPSTPGTAKHRPVQYDAYSPNEIRLKIDLEAPAYLVLSESWHPGWRCWDGAGQPSGGREVKVYHANYLFRAVYLDAGVHDLVFRFCPASVRIGRLVSILGFALILALLTWPALAKRLRRTREA